MPGKTVRTLIRRGCALGLIFTVALTLAAGQYQRTSAAVRADTVRLHILANSDTIADQLCKLRVRDAILAELAPLLRTAATRQAAVRCLQRAVPRLRRAAQRVAGPAVTVSLCSMPFKARDYGRFALPGGEYTALRVELGAAQGQNWFCVLYPALCVDGAAAEYPTAAENALVFGRYRVRFAVWDLLQSGWQALTS